MENTISQRLSKSREAGFQTRAAENGEIFIEGYFAVFGDTYKMWDDVSERVAPTAFDEALGNDIRALINHDSTFVLGRTTSGTLTLRVDSVGLWGSILVNKNDSAAMDLYYRVQRKDVTQCSFGFDILKQSVETNSNETVFVLEKVKLYEVSVVTFPAYEATRVEARKRDYEKIRETANKAWKEKAMQKLKGE